MNPRQEQQKQQPQERQQAPLMFTAEQLRPMQLQLLAASMQGAFVYNMQPPPLPPQVQSASLHYGGDVANDNSGSSTDPYLIRTQLPVQATPFFAGAGTGVGGTGDAAAAQRQPQWTDFRPAPPAQRQPQWTDFLPAPPAQRQPQWTDFLPAPPGHDNGDPNANVP